MIKTYQDIEGWCDYDDLYDFVANKLLQNESVAVEVGVWMGRSVCCLGQQLKIRNKTPKVYAVDTFKGSLNEEPHQLKIKELGGSTLPIFKSHLKDLDLESMITPVELNSEEASKTFKDESIDFIFIDANHEYLEVLKDLQLWYPKIKKTGVLSGHDYWADDVKKAVNEFFNGKGIRVNGASQSCWIVQKN